MGQVYTRHVPPHTGRSERAAPVDVDAVVLGNRHLSADYNVLALDAPGIAARTRPGQFVMIKASRGLDPLLRRPFSVFEILRDAGGQPMGISIFNKRAGVGTSLLSELETGARLQCLGPLGQPFTPIDPPAEAWMVAGGVGLAPFLTLAEALAARRTPTTLFYGARTGAELYSVDLFEALGVRMVLATEDGSTGVKGRVTVPLEEALRARPLGQPVKLFACGPTPMMRSCARARDRARTRVRRVARTGDGLRPGRLLQLRRCRPHATKERCTTRAPASTAPSSTPSASCGRPWDTDGGSLASDRIAPPRQPADRRERLLRLRRRVRRTSSTCNRSAAVAVKGLFLAEREGHPPPRIVETPVGHAECDRAAGHRRAPLHRRAAAGAAAPARRRDRQHLRHDARRICRARANPLRRRGGRTRSS